MAANFLSRGPVSFGKRLAGQIQSPFTLRRLHNSLYDKNQDEASHSDVMPAVQKEEYWTPHPKTGVFGPTIDDNTAGSSGANSVLNQKIFFRHQEDLEKPQFQPN